MNVKEIAALSNLFEKFLEDYSIGDKPLVLYGAGSYCDWVLRFMEKHKIVPIRIIDKKYGGGVKSGISIISIEDAETLYKVTPFRIVIATPMYADEVRNILLQFAAEEDIYSFECELYYSFIHDLDAYRKFLCDNEEEFLKFYHELCDDISRDTMENVLKGRMSGDLSYFRKCRKPDQYYIDELFDSKMKGTFLDVGASIGDTLEALSDKTNNSFEKVYCFEPSQDAYAILKDKAKAYGDRVRLVNKGAWNRQETLEFQEDAEHGASKIAVTEKKNTIKVSVDRLDDMVDGDDKVIHIKMDIEGSEKQALKGAMGIIKRDKPMLAICAYHMNDDFLEIPKLIKQIVPEYKFYLRHHNVAGTETVIYAVI